MTDAAAYLVETRFGSTRSEWRCSAGRTVVMQRWSRLHAKTADLPVRCRGRGGRRSGIRQVNYYCDFERWCAVRSESERQLAYRRRCDLNPIDDRR